MDLKKIGSFIAKLRKERGLSQEHLGEKIGVTNKTISRWETGTYLPPADMLLSMSRLFGVSINEILSGKMLSDDEYKQAAEENLSQAIRTSSFTLKDRIEFFKKKWLKEHIAIMVIIGVLIFAVFGIGFFLKEALIGYVGILLLVLAHGWRNNTMMAYVEKNAYDHSESS